MLADFEEHNLLHYLFKALQFRVEVGVLGFTEEKTTTVLTSGHHCQDGINESNANTVDDVHREGR